MINFSKINNLLTNKSTKKGNSLFGLSCVVHELFMAPSINGANPLWGAQEMTGAKSSINTIQYIHFETQNNVPCLLHVDSSAVEMRNDILKKETILTVWSGYEKTSGYVYTDSGDFDILPEIDVSISPEPYIDLITTLSKSIKDSAYRLAIMVENFLIVNEGDVVTVFNIKGCENPKLLIVVDLLTLANELSVIKIERVFNAVNTIIEETCEKYWINLHSLLIKCQELKIITKGKKDIDSKNLLKNIIKLQTSDRAIKTALESLKM